MHVFETPENPLPVDAKVHVVRTLDGMRLRVLSAPTPAGSVARGTVVILNGRADFMERYFETMRDLQKRGFHVVGFDWRGQGGSQRLLKDHARGHIRSFRQFDEDLRAVMESLVLKICPAPYFALAHSTGGHILFRNLVDRSWFSRCVITAPLLELQFGNWPRWLAFFLSSVAIAGGVGSRFLPGYGRGPILFKKFEGNPLTSDAKRWTRDMRTLEQHVSLAVGGPTYSWLNACMRSLKELHGRRTRGGLQCPVLIVLAGRELVVDNTGAHRFARHVPGVSVVTIKNSMHEMLLESDQVRAEFFAAFDAYMVPLT